MIAPRGKKQDQRENRNTGRSSGGGQAHPTDRQKPDAQPISAPHSTPESGPAGKLTQIKTRIAELLDLVEALQPGFAKDVGPKLEMNRVVAPKVKSRAGDRQALLASLEELAELLEELVELLRNRRSEDTDDTPSEGIMEAVAFGYEKAAERPEPEKEPRSADMFMSIYDQLSPEVRVELVGILTVMTFEDEDQEQGPAAPSSIF
jgi:hypothetical protein